jgi:hypothetical protein
MVSADPTPKIAWLRIRAGAGFGQYTYLQDPEPNIKDNPLYSGTVSLNNSPMKGADFEASAWIPEAPWIGFDAKVQVARYVAGWPSTAVAQAPTKIPDFIPVVSSNVQARYAFSEGGFNFYTAAKAGFMYSDFMRYTWTSQQQTTVEYTALGASGFSTGVEIGGDTLDGDLFFSIGLTAGFLGVRPYATIVDLEAGYAFLPNLYGSLSFNQFSREIRVVHASTSTPLGVLSDSGWSLSAGLGFQY